MCAATTENTLTENELMLWRMCLKSYAECPYLLWKDLTELAMRKIGSVVYRGDFWAKQVNTLAESYLDVLGVQHEMHAGHRYVAGKRIYWAYGRWNQDDFR